MEELRVHLIHYTMTAEIGLVTSSCWQTKTRGGTRPQFVNQTSCNTKGFSQVEFTMQNKNRTKCFCKMASKPKKQKINGESCVETEDIQSVLKWKSLISFFIFRLIYTRLISIFIMLSSYQVSSLPVPEGHDHPEGSRTPPRTPSRRRPRHPHTNEVTVQMVDSTSSCG